MESRWKIVTHRCVTFWTASTMSHWNQMVQLLLQSMCYIKKKPDPMQLAFNSTSHSCYYCCLNHQAKQTKSFEPILGTILHLADISTMYPDTVMAVFFHNLQWKHSINFHKSWTFNLQLSLTNLLEWNPEYTTVGICHCVKAMQSVAFLNTMVRDRGHRAAFKRQWERQKFERK